MLDLEYLAQLAAEHKDALAARVQEFSLGGHRFQFNTRPVIMGVINLSADSWYRESVCLSVDSALQRARVLQAQGAAIVDIGAESTLSHAVRVDELGQKSKLLPLIKELAAAGQLISAETYNMAVAKACLEAGAKVLNCTSSVLTAEDFRMVADHDAAVILCYVEGDNVREVGEFNLSGDVPQRMREFFARQIDLATENGLTKIFIDPGMGFYYRNLQDSAQRVRHQMQTFLNTFRLRTLGFPTCHALPHAFDYFGEEVRSAEAFFCVLAAMGKTDLFRTHEVPRIRAVLDTMRAF